MNKPRLLDLFCGAGGCSMGYHRAGFEVVGVDINPQPRYPFEFHQADAMTYPLEGFDVIHASPPCKAHTKTGWAIYFGYRGNHADLLTPTRERLVSQEALWVIENVPGSPMRPDVVLCGSQFGLNLRRHRWFEASFPIFTLLTPCSHKGGVASPHGHARKAGQLATWAPALGIDWMTEDEMAQAIPPAYTEWIGKQLMEAL
jgi:hypothetical protein